MNNAAAGSYSRQRFTLKELLVMIVLFVVLVAVTLPATFGLRLARERARRVNCAGNLKCMGWCAMLMYSGDHAGYFPPTFPNGGDNWYPVASEDYVTSVGKIWACPSSDICRSYETWSAYRYVGSGLKDDDPNATTVSLGYDRSGNHPGNYWVNVLFIDGHVEGAQPGTKPGFSND